MAARAMVAAMATALLATGASAGAGDFTYRYPAQARAIPALRAWLEADRTRLRAALLREEAAGRRDAKADGIEFHSYETTRDWQVVADTPRFLSLSLTTSDFSGGAHPNGGFGALVWDRAGGVRRRAVGFFDAARLRAAIRAPFCRALDRQRREKRGADWRPTGDEFDACIDPLASTLILGSHHRDRFDRIGILIAPYEAGPYAEGDYEVTLPVTPAVLAAVRPEWRRYFAVSGTP